MTHIHATQADADKFLDQQRPFYRGQFMINSENEKFQVHDLLIKEDKKDFEIVCLLKQGSRPYEEIWRVVSYRRLCEEYKIYNDPPPRSQKKKRMV